MHKTMNRLIDTRWMPCGVSDDKPSADCDAWRDMEPTELDQDLRDALQDIASTDINED